jgi:hypothetical protein
VKEIQSGDYVCLKGDPTVFLVDEVFSQPLRRNIRIHEGGGYFRWVTPEQIEKIVDSSWNDPKGPVSGLLWAAAALSDTNVFPGWGPLRSYANLMAHEVSLDAEKLAIAFCDFFGANMHPHDDAGDADHRDYMRYVALAVQEMGL